MTQKSKARNVDFKNCGEAATTTLGAKGPVKLKNPWAEGPSILRTFPSEPFEPSSPKGACPMSLFFQYAAEGVFFSVFSVFHVDALDFRGEAGEGVDAVY